MDYSVEKVVVVLFVIALISIHIAEPNRPQHSPIPLSHSRPPLLQISVKIRRTLICLCNSLVPLVPVVVRQVSEMRLLLVNLDRSLIPCRVRFLLRQR